MDPFLESADREALKPENFNIDRAEITRYSAFLATRRLILCLASLRLGTNVTRVEMHTLQCTLMTLLEKQSSSVNDTDFWRRRRNMEARIQSPSNAYWMINTLAGITVIVTCAFGDIQRT